MCVGAAQRGKCEGLSVYRFEGDGQNQTQVENTGDMEQWVDTEELERQVERVEAVPKDANQAQVKTCGLVTTSDCQYISMGDKQREREKSFNSDLRWARC